MFNKITMFDKVIKEWDDTLYNVAFRNESDGSCTIIYKNGEQHNVTQEYANSVLVHTINPNDFSDLKYSELP